MQLRREDHNPECGGGLSRIDLSRKSVHSHGGVDERKSNRLDRQRAHAEANR
jgi:hypothetical protein